MFFDSTAKPSADINSLSSPSADIKSSQSLSLNKLKEKAQAFADFCESVGETHIFADTTAIVFNKTVKERYKDNDADFKLISNFYNHTVLQPLKNKIILLHEYLKKTEASLSKEVAKLIKGQPTAKYPSITQDRLIVLKKEQQEIQQMLGHLSSMSEHCKDLQTSLNFDGLREFVSNFLFSSREVEKMYQERVYFDEENPKLLKHMERDIKANARGQAEKNKFVAQQMKKLREDYSLFLASAYSVRTFSRTEGVDYQSRSIEKQLAKLKEKNLESYRALEHTIPILAEAFLFLVSNGENKSKGDEISAKINLIIDLIKNLPQEAKSHWTGTLRLYTHGPKVEGKTDEIIEAPAKGLKSSSDEFIFTSHGQKMDDKTYAIVEAWINELKSNSEEFIFASQASMEEKIILAAINADDSQFSVVVDNGKKLRKMIFYAPQHAEKLLQKALTPAHFSRLIKWPTDLMETLKLLTCFPAFDKMFLQHFLLIEKGNFWNCLTKALEWSRVEPFSSFVKNVLQEVLLLEKEAFMHFFPEDIKELTQLLKSLPAKQSADIMARYLEGDSQILKFGK